MQEENCKNFYRASLKRQTFLNKLLLILLLGANFLMLAIPQAKAQEVTDYEISALKNQLDTIEAKITPIDSELNLLIPEYDEITNEISNLKTELRESKGFVSKVTGFFKERKLGNLLTKAQEKNNRITGLQKKRDPLARDYVILADRLIDRSGLRIVVLMDIMLKSETASGDRISRQISYIWQLAEKVRAARNKYAPNITDQQKAKPFLPPIGNDPTKLRQAAKITKDAAAEMRADAQKKKKKIRELENGKRSYERMIDRWKEIMSNEETESRGAESGTANIPSAFNEADIKRKIDKMQEDINKISNEIREREDNAGNLENQSRLLEQRASQIEATQKGK